jgi:eukaryotic-like serine/threonine-protein kinase
MSALLDTAHSGEPTVPPGGELAPGFEAITLLSRNQAMDVYDVWDEERDCRVVAKLVRPDRSNEPRLRQRLLDEARLLTGLAHPHLVRGYQLLPEPQPVLILETLTGSTLDHLLESRRRRLPLADIAMLGMQICSAVQYLHRHGVVHLDIKPGNLICEETGQVKLIDLSLARPPCLLRRGIGTRDYLAPEQALGGWVAEPADVWGIGSVLYEAAAGRRAFTGTDNPRRYAQLERSPLPLRKLRRVPGGFARTVSACLAPAPEERPTIGELNRELDQLAG